MKMKNVILAASVAFGWACFANAAAPGVAWTSRQGFMINRDCRINAAAADAQGNLYLAGSIDNGANEDFYTCKIDGATDSIVWRAIYNGPDDDLDQATGCSLDSNGNLYVTGFSHDSTDYDFLTIKYDAATGAVGWTKRYNTVGKTNEYASSCTADRFGNVYVAGTFNEDSSYYSIHGVYHALVLKYNGATGDTIWSHHFNDLPDSMSEANDCCVDDSGNPYVVGYVSPGGYNTYAYAMKLNRFDGDTIWLSRYTGANTEAAGSCCIDAGGNLIVVGTSGVVILTTMIRYRVTDGDTLWTKVFTNDNTLPQDCAATIDGAILLSASTLIGDQYTVRKVDIDSGSVQWSQSFARRTNNQPAPLAVKDASTFFLSSSNAMGNMYVPESQWEGIYSARHSAITGNLIDSVSRSQSLAGGWNFAYDCAVSGNNGPAIAGSAGTFYAALLLNPGDGHIVWEKRDPDAYDIYHARNSRATGVAQSSGCVYTTGNIGTTGLLTYKFNTATGDTLWTVHNSYGFSYVTGADCIPDKWGNLFVAGYDGENPVGADTSIAIKYGQANGDTVWTGRNPGLQSTVACTADSSGAFYVLGQSSGGYMIEKYDNSTGDTIWTRFTPYGAEPRGIAYGNGSVYVATSSGYSLVKHSILNGDTLWSRRFVSPYHLYDRAASCAVDDSGFIYLTGSSYNGADYDIWTLKCTPDGDTLWSARYNGPDGKDDFGRGCCVDSLGYLYVTGFSATGRGYDMVTIKYNTGYTGVSGNAPGPAATAFSLSRPYPNPSNGGIISMQYYLPTARQVRIDVYNITGQRVSTIDNASMSAGRHTASWKGTNGDGIRAANGIYVLRGSFGEITATRKVLVIR